MWNQCDNANRKQQIKNNTDNWQRKPTEKNKFKTLRHDGKCFAESEKKIYN